MIYYIPGRKWVTYLLSQLINDGGVCRAAPGFATGSPKNPSAAHGRYITSFVFPTALCICPIIDSISF